MAAYGIAQTGALPENLFAGKVLPGMKMWKLRDGKDTGLTHSQEVAAMELYSIRMRAAQGGPHELGGRHISGAERLVAPAAIETTVTGLVQRALTHSRGRADFINVTVEMVDPASVRRVALLPVKTIPVRDYQEGRAAALDRLAAAGVTKTAAAKALARLLALTESMRGAMLVDARSGERLDTYGQRGVRVTRMDISPDGERVLRAALRRQGLDNDHVREALVLASKVVSAPGVVAELCWSDDPEYTAGYVATAQGYMRFPHLKPGGSGIGGRVFFLAPGAAVEDIVVYLQDQAVVVEPGDNWHIAC